MAARHAGRRARSRVRRLAVVAAVTGVAMCCAPATGLALADGTGSTPGSCSLLPCPPPSSSPPPTTPPSTEPPTTPPASGEPSSTPSSEPSATAGATATRSSRPGTSASSASGQPTARHSSRSSATSGATSFPSTKITPAPSYDPSQLEALAQAGAGPEATGAPAPVSAAASSDSADDPIGTVLLLTIGLSAALGVAGGAGLYLTRSGSS